MRRYYLRRRSNNGNWTAIIMNANTRKPAFSRSTGTSNKKQADAIAQGWLVNGLPDSNRITKDKNQLRNIAFTDYCRRIWDFDTSEYLKWKVKELQGFLRGSFWTDRRLPTLTGLR
uniref:Uncharacterized protein n=1 Tax=uncultured bacterium contig00019 TaxID=1181510 RepID=A0A806KE66_9BACT|nr:hypothetical protein [uncultured bacterium contig00019]